MENRNPRRLLVTGGAGFIGSNFVQYWCDRYPEDRMVVLDALTYAGNLANLEQVKDRPQFRFVQGDIGDRSLIDPLLAEENIDTIAHFAAESHVDRSILGPGAFVQTNVVGTFTLLEAFRQHYPTLPNQKGLFLHVSTDEVYGSLGPNDPAFQETTPYAPNSPYSASKAGSDHLVRAYYHTYDFPTIITNCSNNYGPYQFPEKLIPLMTINTLIGKNLPVYGDGQNIRDWLYVIDHCSALDVVIHQGKPGETYNVGGNNEVKNIDLVTILCDVMDELAPQLPVRPCRNLITFVKDRLGHDRRYAIDATKIKTELGWQPSVTVEEGLRQTLKWYLEHQDWWQPLLSQEYQDYYRQVYEG
ncbi:MULTISPECIES: dTDP-glucose 4,6-dehydratase [unclassified Roseofilum]|uniref:dTDP-glucose 4,6-dehydratase n=1 Tax=unclassified Roseofilum TaxID=2620099 RepID=UPI000E9A1B50|nr:MULTISPECIES: dTDP-glucose 4,6-dehydratase [unclassified Roseofilum]MBP0007497.1 dTDP-glucose 4,6-dehydratase [Roseofilum sp. Belize Diploria]MBP0031775.1 dTDP-glucose 4,6-dehydratase [Roseofilum sp. Belize BBD 4]HBQ98377.1 dTDP-glucose 4,6-dehydratase [Cyanobacteria bacterium UBA11691]